LSTVNKHLALRPRLLSNARRPAT